MAKKPPATNKKVLMIGGGAIVVLALLLIGAYGNSIKTQIGIGVGQVIPLNPPDSQACTDARDYYTDTSNIYSLSCTPTILLSLPHIPSSQCYTALINLADAEKAVNERCGPPAPRPGDDEDGVFLPPVIPPPIFDLFATTTPQPSATPPASARPGV